VCLCVRVYVCWNSPSTKYNTKSFAIATGSEEPTSDKHCDLLANSNDRSVVGIFCKVTECIWGDHSFTLQVRDVKLSTYCLIHMPISNKTLVHRISKVWFHSW